MKPEQNMWAAVFYRALDWVAAAVRRLEAWAEAHPRAAWATTLLLVLLAVGWEASYWPRHDYPGAMWHNEDRGIDIEAMQEFVSGAGWKEVREAWHTGLLGNPTWRPLITPFCMLQYQLFGENDRLWSLVCIGLHLIATAVMVWAVSHFVTGPLLKRLGFGAAAALLFGGPGLADRDVQRWIIGWWPAQPDIFSLTFGLVVLAGAVLYVRTGKRRWAAAALGAFFLGVCFKEMAYVSGLGACLILLRHRKGWPLLGGVAAMGIVLFAYRTWLFPKPKTPPEDDVARVVRTLANMASNTGTALGLAAIHMVLLAVALGLAYALRRRFGLLERGLIAAAVYFGLGTPILGPPWEALFAAGTGTILEVLLAGVYLFGLALAFRGWPMLELGAVFILSAALGMAFPPILAWHRYWMTAFGSILTAAVLFALGEWLWVRRAAAPELPDAEPVPLPRPEGLEAGAAP